MTISVTTSDIAGTDKPVGGVRRRDSDKKKKMKKVEESIYAVRGGSAPGKHEVLSLTVQQAFDILKKSVPDVEFRKLGNIAKNFLALKKVISGGWMSRKDMPVLSSNIIDEYIAYILRKDIGVIRKKVPARKLKVSQSQVYFSKVVDSIAQHGIANSKKFVQSKYFVCSSDYTIIDGHHRYCTAMILDPDMQVPVVYVNADVRRLIEISNEFSDSIGNKRNQ